MRLLKVSRHRSIHHCLLAIIIQVPLAVLAFIAKEFNMSEAKRWLREFENHIAFISSDSDSPELVHTVVIDMTQYQ